jgi:hypothetical protein
VLGSNFSIYGLADQATVISNVGSNSPLNFAHIIILFPSGRSCLLANHNMIATTNLFDGVDYYDLANQNLVDSLRMTITDNVVTPIASGNTGSLIVGGSSGAVHVLQAFPATVVQTLELQGE